MKNMAFFEPFINELKFKLVHEQEFSDTFKYFFDTMGNSRDFILLGKRDNSPDLKKLMQAIGEKALQKKVMATRFFITLIPEHRFYHGACHLNEILCTFIFFREFSMGMAAIAVNQQEIKTLFARFTAYEAPNKRISLAQLSSGTPTHQ